jgi:hypothetical protein
LDHVVGAGVANDGDAVVAGRGQQRVLGDGVAALGEHDRALRADAGGGGGVVPAVGGDDLEPERAQSGHVRLDGAGAEVAAAGIGKLEVVDAVHQWAEEHDDAAGTPGCLGVHRGEVELGRHDELEVVVGVEPAEADANGLQDLEQSVDFLDARHLAQHRGALVEERGTQQGDAGVLAGLHVDGAGQGGAASDPQMAGSGRPDADQLGVEGTADAREHLERQVLLPLLDAVDGALARLELGGELRLREAAVLTCVADERADPGQVVVAFGHGLPTLYLKYEIILHVLRMACRGPQEQGHEDADDGQSSGHHSDDTHVW